MGGFGIAGIFFIVLVVLAIFFVGSAVVTVRQGYEYTVERFWPLHPHPATGVSYHYALL